MAGPRAQRISFEAWVRERVAHDPLIAGVTECMLRAWAALWTEDERLHQMLVQIIGRDELCRRFCRIPGVGPVTALSVRAAIDDRRRFVKSKTGGAHFGLTSRRIQTSASIDIEGRISKCGDGEVRTVLYEAASAMLVRSKKWCRVKAWRVRIVAKRGHKRVVVAVARKLAVIMHRMWLGGSEFRFSAADGMRVATEQAKRRRSVPRVEGSGERRLADGLTAENGFEFRRLAERRLVDRNGCGEHDILPAPTPLWRLRARGNAGGAPRSRHRHVRPHGMRG